MSEIDQGQNTEFEAPLDRVRPIVLTLKKKKKRGKRRYSKGLEEVQRMERHLTRSAQRMTRAAEKGVTTYRKLSIKSAENKKDGAILDFIPNTGIAMSRSMREASTIPYDIARAIDTPKNRKRLRSELRSLSRRLRKWRW
jgi:hypothetical protein